MIGTELPLPPPPSRHDDSTRIDPAAQVALGPPKSSVAEKDTAAITVAAFVPSKVERLAIPPLLPASAS